MSEPSLKPRFRLAALGERGLPFLALMAAGWVFLSAAELPAAPAASAPAAPVVQAPATSDGQAPAVAAPAVTGAATATR